MVSCDFLDMGCNGGWLGNAWSYLEKTGIVTDSCFPYASGDGKAPKCVKKCVSGESFTKYKCKKGTVVTAKNPEAAKSLIYAGGPAETRFTVFEDFMSYKTGVYQYTTGKQLGGHAIKVVGWGQENGINYWICANSWSTSWGEDGFFRIAFGECGIDEQVVACTPDLSSAVSFLL